MGIYASLKSRLTGGKRTKRKWNVNLCHGWTKDHEHCVMPPWRAGGDYCWMHDPGVSDEQRREASAKGGRHPKKVAEGAPVVEAPREEPKPEVKAQADWQKIKWPKKVPRWYMGPWPPENAEQAQRAAEAAAMEHDMILHAEQAEARREEEEEAAERVRRRNRKFPWNFFDKGED